MSGYLDSVLTTAPLNLCKVITVQELCCLMLRAGLTEWAITISIVKKIDIAKKK